MTPLPRSSGSIALPTTAPSIRPRSIPFIAYPGVEDVTSKSPRRMGPFSALTLQGTIPTIAKGISPTEAGASILCALARTPGLVE
jgi:hypothetical protein